MEKDTKCEYCDGEERVYPDPKSEEETYNPKWVPCICQLPIEK